MYKKTVETNKDTARKYTSIILGEQIKSPLNLIYKLEELACRNDIYIDDVLYNIQNKE